VEGRQLIAQDGTARDADAIIFATGFHVTDMPLASRVYGAGGGTLAAAWQPGMSALRGTTVPGFPNLCLVIGPNTGLGHNSLIHIIEAQLDYILDYLAQLDRTGAAALDTRPDAHQRWAASIARRMASTVWTTGGCTSWYLAADGRNPTLWPGSVRGFRQATRRVSLDEYQLIPAPAGRYATWVWLAAKAAADVRSDVSRVAARRVRSIRFTPIAARSSGPGVSSVTRMPWARSACASRSSDRVTSARSRRSSRSSRVAGRSVTRLAIGDSTYASATPARASTASEVGDRTPPST
jgi:hypothetical protein